MKYLDEYRDKEVVHALLDQIRTTLRSPCTIMEVCGGQTHSIMKYNLPELLPPEIALVHGPGCPVCVTPVNIIDQAIEIAGKEDVILLSFGDMLRVPGSTSDLLSVKAQGADVRMVYSPIDCLRFAEENPEKKIVFFAVGFETTAPSVALLVKEARAKQLPNLFVLVSHVLVPPAMEAILASGRSGIQAFLAAGHVCTVMGYHQYVPLAERYKVPVVITGFEPVDILLGILKAVSQLESGRHFAENAYSRMVSMEGNRKAQELLREVFEIRDMEWRGIGVIPDSGFSLREEYRDYDALSAFRLNKDTITKPSVCIAGQVLQGLKKPTDCKAFGKECRPESPLGAPMVSGEGACAAYYRYKTAGIHEGT